MAARELTNGFDIPKALRFEDGPGGLTRALVSTPAAEAELYRQGAHLTQWTPRGQRPVLYVSSTSLFAPGKAIRGGVPIIFPWFGSRGDGKPGPAHGFARTLEWVVESTKLREDAGVEIMLSLASNDATRALFEPDFRAHLRVALGSELEVELEVRNEGPERFTFEEALHTYFAVGDIREASVTGLEGTTYIDKTDGFKRKRQGSEPVCLSKETDQVHVDATATCIIHDAVWKRRIVIEKSGSSSTVVWNPWSEKTKGMPDMPADGWKEMLCVETANAADNAVHLSPGESHKLNARIRIA